MLLAAKAKRKRETPRRPAASRSFPLSPALLEREKTKSMVPFGLRELGSELELAIGGRKRSKGFNLRRFRRLNWPWLGGGEPTPTSLPFRPLLRFPRLRRAAPIDSEVRPTEKDPSQEGN